MRRHMIWLLVGLLAAGFAFAREEADSEDVADFEEDLYFAPAETVSSAARHEQTVAESPSAVTILTAEDIDGSGARTLPELLRRVPGMDVYHYTPTWYAVGIRGLTTENSDKLLLLVDGKDTTVRFLGSPVWTMSYLSMDDVEKVEVIRGPGSALYGANAYSGVVSVTTHAPGSGHRLNASVRGGEQGSTELACRASETFGKLGLAVSTGLQRDALLSDRSTPGREFLFGRLTGRLELGSDATVAIDTGAFLAQGGAALIRRFTFRESNNVYGLARFAFRDLSGQVSLERTTLDGDLDLEVNVAAFTGPIARVPHVTAVLDKLVTSLQHFFEMRHNRLSYGAQYFFERNQVNITIPGEYRHHRLGVFLQDELRLGELLGAAALPLTLTAGLRVDTNSLTGWEASPRAALVYTPTQSHGLRFGFSRAFLEPTHLQRSLRLRLDDLSGAELLTEMDMRNPDLGDQTITSLELGYTGRFLDGKLELQVDLAYNWYRDIILFEIDNSKIEYRNWGGILIPDLTKPWFGYTNNNAGHNGHNLEASLVARPFRSLRLHLVAGYRQVFDNRTGRFSQTEPVWHLASGACLGIVDAWKLSLNGAFTSAVVRQFSNRQDITRDSHQQRIGPTWLLSARLARTVKLTDLGLTIGIEAYHLLGNRYTELGTIPVPNGHDYNAERIDRRVVLFLQGTI